MEDTSNIYIYFYYVNFIIVYLNYICSYIIITNWIIISYQASYD